MQGPLGIGDGGSPTSNRSAEGEHRVVVDPTDWRSSFTVSVQRTHVYRRDSSILQEGVWAAACQKHRRSQYEMVPSSASCPPRYLRFPSTAIPLAVHRTARQTEGSKLHQEGLARRVLFLAALPAPGPGTPRSFSVPPTDLTPPHRSAHAQPAQNASASDPESTGCHSLKRTSRNPRGMSRLPQPHLDRGRGDRVAPALRLCDKYQKTG